jgi:hypothetical protein
MTTTLNYVSHARIEDLKPGECTIHRAGDGKGNRWWLLRFYDFREDQAGGLEDFAVPVNPNGNYANGPGGRTWGLTKVDTRTWAINPSISISTEKVLSTEFHSDCSPELTIWHKTPTLLNVPEDEP